MIDSNLRMLPAAEAGTRKSARRDRARSHDKEVHRKAMVVGNELVDHVVELDWRAEHFMDGRDLGPTNNSLGIGTRGECWRGRSGTRSLAQDTCWTGRKEYG